MKFASEELRTTVYSVKGVFLLKTMGGAIHVALSIILWSYPEVKCLGFVEYFMHYTNILEKFINTVLLLDSIKADQKS